MAASRQQLRTRSSSSSGSRPPGDGGDDDDLGEASRPVLTFQWGEIERRWPNLFKWLVLTVLGMVGFSYVFKVAYPQYQVTVTAPHQVTVLNTADPASAPLLHKIADKDFLIIPDSAPHGDVRLEDHVPVFHPSYEKHEFRLEDLPHAPSPVPPARLLDPTAPVLPPMDVSQLKRTPGNFAAAAGKPRLELLFEGPLGKRKITHLPNFSPLALADPEAWKLHVGVDPRGHVTFALPIATGVPASRLTEIVNLLQEMRFEPQATPEGEPPSAEPLTWDNVTFEWRRSAPP